MSHYSKAVFRISSLIIIGLSSCIENRDLYIPQQDTYSEVELFIGGECNTTMIPTPDATSNTKRIYGITVAQWIKDANGSPQAKPYAYGIFDNVSNLKLNLIDRYKYRIACTMIENGKDSILFSNEGYGRPFTLDEYGTNYGMIQNRFLTVDPEENTPLFLFNADNSNIETKNQDKEITRPFIRRYHGVIDSLETHMIGNEVEMYRRYFAIKYIVNGLQENCKLEVQMDDSPKWTFTPEKNETDYTYVSFKNLTNKIPKSGVLSEEVAIRVRFYRNGIMHPATMTFYRTLKRNHKASVVIDDLDEFGTDGRPFVSLKDEGELEKEPTVDLP